MRAQTIRTAIAAVALAAGLAACAHVPHVHHVAAKVECGIQYHDWSKKGGLDKLHAAGTQIAVMAKAVENHQSKSVSKNASTVEDAITAAQKDLPPACIPGLDSNVSRALGDAKVAVKDAAKQDTTSLKASGNKLKDAKEALKAAAKDVKNYLKS